MKSEYPSAFELPRERTGTIVRWLAEATVARVSWLGLTVYLAVVLIFSAIEIIALYYGIPLVVYQQGDMTKAADGWLILYFNFVTILTIGYGDFTPAGMGKVLAISEAIVGTGVLGVTIAALTAKFLSPPRNSIVFSKYGYYCIDEQRFLIIFVNTTKNLLVNVEMSSYFKLGGDWGVRNSIRSPFVTQAVQTFFLDCVPIGDLVKNLTDGDVFRFAIECRIGDTAFSIAIQYSPEEIIVLPDRKELIAYPGFWNFDFRSEEFSRMFHYRPDGAPTLVEYLGTRDQD
jgi:hypothetical protein